MVHSLKNDMSYKYSYSKMKIIRNLKTTFIFTISIFLFLMGISMFFIEFADRKNTFFLFFGAIVGFVVFLNGGLVPRPLLSVIRLLTWNSLTKDDDPRNLPWYIFWPILLTVLLIAGFAIGYGFWKL